MVNVFLAKSYRDFLHQFIRSHGAEAHGLKSSLAAAAACQPTYLSRVLSSKAHLSLEQGNRLASFMGLSDEAAHYFLLLIQRERAGTVSLKKYFQAQLDEALERNLRVASRIDVKDALTPEAQAIYYSSWVYSACHALMSIPDFQSTESIAAALSLDKKKTNEIIEFLCSIGLLARKGDRYEIGLARIHLDQGSPFIRNHHSNWRMQALRAIERSNENNLHYSSVVSLSGQDIPKIRELSIQYIEALKQIIKNSKEEKVYSLCLDFFKAV